MVEALTKLSENTVKRSDHSWVLNHYDTNFFKRNNELF